MPSNASKNIAQKITISLPKNLADRFKSRVPRRQRSEFIAQLLEKQFAIEEQLAALDESAGCWSEANHPDLRNDEQIDEWLSNLRGGWQRNEAG